MSDGKSVYQIVTDKIIELLDQGIVPWHKPWRSASFNMPISVHGHRYRGINIFLLAARSMADSFSSPIWLTFKQANEMGGGIKPGEKGQLVVFWKMLKIDGKNEMNEEVKKNIPLLRYYTVFNFEQTAGVKLPKKMQAIQDAVTDIDDVYEGGAREEQAIAQAEAIIKGYVNGPKVVFKKGAQALYNTVTDVIQLARKVDFESVEAYYTTFFHEIGHSTGHPDRLARKVAGEFNHFGDQKYAEEELVAEMTAAFLSGEAGIDTQVEQAAAYIKNWKQRLADDPKLIVQVAAKAQKAADLVLGREFETKES